MSTIPFGSVNELHQMLEAHIIVCLTLLKVADQVVEVLLFFIVLTHESTKWSTVILLLFLVEGDQYLLDQIVLDLLLFQQLLLLVLLLKQLFSVLRFNLFYGRCSLTMHMIYNIITLIIIESSLLLNYMRYWPCGRLELALMLGIVVLLSLILEHFLFFHLLRIYSTVVFAPDNEFLMGLLVKQIVLRILLWILLLLRLILGCKSYDSRTGCLLLLLLEQAYIDTLPFKELHLKRSQIEVIKRLIIILLRCVLLRNILMNVRRDGVWGVFADFTAVFLKYLLLLGICIDGYRIRRDLGRFHQSILGVMQVRSRLYVSDCISLLIRLNLIIGSRYCWIRIVLANWIVFTLEGRMSQFLLLMMLQFAQMIRICKGALMRINFLNGLMVDLLMRVHLILLGSNNVILVVLLGLTSSDKSSLCRRLIWDNDSSLSHICRVSWCWTIHDVHPIGCQMVIFLHHIRDDWSLDNAVMNI